MSWSCVFCVRDLLAWLCSLVDCDCVICVSCVCLRCALLSVCLRSVALSAFHLGNLSALGLSVMSAVCQLCCLVVQCLISTGCFCFYETMSSLLCVLVVCMMQFVCILLMTVNIIHTSVPDASLCIDRTECVTTSAHICVCHIFKQCSCCCYWSTHIVQQRCYWCPVYIAVNKEYLTDKIF